MTECWAWPPIGHAVVLWLCLSVPLLPREGEFAGRVALLQRGHFAILHDELINNIPELRCPELEPLDGNELDGRSARERKRKTGSRLIEYFKFNFGRSRVSASQLFEQRRVQRRGLAREYNFRRIQRYHRAINVALRICPEVHGELAVLLVIERVKAVVMKVAQRKIEGMKTELQRVILEPNFKNAVGRVLIVARVVGQGMRWLGIRNAIAAGFRTRFRARFLPGKALLELALAPRRPVHAEEPLLRCLANQWPVAAWLSAHSPAKLVCRCISRRSSARSASGTARRYWK